jgi:hypothetical protein
VAVVVVVARPGGGFGFGFGVGLAAAGVTGQVLVVDVLREGERARDGGGFFAGERLVACAVVEQVQRRGRIGAGFASAVACCG